jgi:uncharacterized protein YkwD
MHPVAARAGIGALIAGLAVTVAPGVAAGAPGCERPAVAQADEAALTAMINTARKAEGVRKVSKHPGLAKAGRKKSMAMAAGARFAHSGSLPWARGRAAGQNLAMAPDAGAAFRAMLASPSHRRNLLAREWRFTGVGAARNCAGVVYFTINLMAPPA